MKVRYAPKIDFECGPYTCCGQEGIRCKYLIHPYDAPSPGWCHMFRTELAGAKGVGVCKRCPGCQELSTIRKERRRDV